MMFYIYLVIVILYLAMMFVIWQMGKLKKENLEWLKHVQNHGQQIHAQEQHLKQALQIMQDLAKKMHIQQQVLDNTSTRLTQVEFQNAELIKILQQNSKP
ncbi:MULTISPECIES: hypothetical protein [unclassified Acinetobacter]|nr:MULTISPECIES: hypothetical protein [unclassified Acinetobacter]WEE37854.1 hypothetical protein PYV58_12940 [Acinetobacter sp. TAC-1]